MKEGTKQGRVQLVWRVLGLHACANTSLQCSTVLEYRPSASFGDSANDKYCCDIYLHTT